MSKASGPHFARVVGPWQSRACGDSWHAGYERARFAAMPSVRIKRVYEKAHSADGCRVLVDRLWPRGVSRDRAAIDHWMKDVGPSNKLRTWFGHRDDRWEEFESRYRKELKTATAVNLLRQLRRIAAKGPLTLVYSARDAAHNQAVVLARVLRGRRHAPPK